MSKLARTISTTLAATGLAAGLAAGGVATAASASAAPPPTGGISTTQGSAYQDRAFLGTVRSYAWEARFYSDGTIINAGHYACQRKDARGLRFQVGTVRSRIIAAVEADVRNRYFSGNRVQLSQVIVSNTGVNPSNPFGFC